MASTLGFSPVHCPNSRAFRVLPVPINPFITSHLSTVSSSSSNNIHQLKLKQFPRPQASSSEGVPTELIEDSKFVPLNADDPSYGPPALLLLGFEVGEAVKIQQLLKELDGEFLEGGRRDLAWMNKLFRNWLIGGSEEAEVWAVIFCTEDMITRPIWEAMHTTQPHLEAVKIAKSLPRICFLSGLSGEEMMMFIDAYQETGLEPAVFAALVPNSADKPLQELIDEIMGDYEMLNAKQSSST